MAAWFSPDCHSTDKSGILQPILNLGGDMLVNGYPQDFLSLADRAIHYGDGAFETVLVDQGHPVHWARHLARLERACDILKIPFDIPLLEKDLQTQLAQAPDSCIIKIMITRGCGGRGYTPPQAPMPTRIVTAHALPPEYAALSRSGVRVVRCRHPLSENPALAGLKHLNRLDQVLASMELPADCHEGLMCNSRDLLVEGVKSNVFVVRAGKLITPLLDRSGVAGIQREVILDYCAQHKMPVDVRDIRFAEVHLVDEIFLCNSIFGIWPVTELRCEDTVQHLPAGPVTRMLQQTLGEPFLNHA
jgi:4-amino-4-deoxychorismate lyase